MFAEYTIAKVPYYLCSEIQQAHKDLNKRCTSATSFVKKHAIAQGDWIHARCKDGVWIKSPRYSTKTDKVMISVAYYKSTLVPVPDEDESEECDDEEESEKVGECDDEEESEECDDEEESDECDDEEESEECDDEEESEEVEQPKYKRLPAEIILSKQEAFRDENGKRLQVRVVGKRTSTGFFFNVGDVSKAFGLKRLVDNVTDQKSGYEENVHYRVFLVSAQDASRNSGSKVSTKATDAKCVKAPRSETHYLTYAGLGRALFTCSSKTAPPFLSWAIDVLFTAHMGTAVQKEALASKLTGISLEGVQNLCRATSGITSCVYLFTFGTVKDLRKSMKIGKECKDDALVCKFGRTKDLARRTREHAKKYRMKGTRLELLYFGRVDVKHASKAEAEIRDVFEGHEMGFEYDNSTEIVIIPTKKLTAIKKAYDAYTELNLGRVKQLVLAVREKDAEIATLNAVHEIAMLKITQELKDSQAENALLKMTQELNDAKHEAEILRYRLAGHAKVTN